MEFCEVASKESEKGHWHFKVIELTLAGLVIKLERKEEEKIVFKFYFLDAFSWLKVFCHIEIYVGWSDQTI